LGQAFTGKSEKPSSQQGDLRNGEISHGSERIHKVQRGKKGNVVKARSLKETTISAWAIPEKKGKFYPKRGFLEEAAARPLRCPSVGAIEAFFLGGRERIEGGSESGWSQRGEGG